MKKRTFTQLKKEMGENFEKFCKKLTEEYAKSDAQFARTYFCQTYNITVSCYYKVLEEAVTKNLVEDVVVSKMMKKAVSNQNLHKSGSGGSSLAKYARMYTQRCKYIASTFAAEEIEEIAVDFGNSPEIGKVDFATMYGLNRRVLEELLVKAIVENIADDKAVDAIELRSINNANPAKVQMTKEYFIALRKKRACPKGDASHCIS